MEEIVKEKRRFWESIYQRGLTDEDVRQIVTNIAAFFEILAEWEKGEKEARDCGESTDPYFT